MTLLSVERLAEGGDSYFGREDTTEQALLRHQDQHLLRHTLLRYTAEFIACVVRR